MKTIGLLLSDITDHLPIFAVIQTTQNQEVNKIDFLTRDYHNVDTAELNRLIEEFNPYINSNTLSIDEKFHKLQDHINHCIDKLIPLRKLTKREISFKRKPWISIGLQKSISYKNKLYDKIILKNRLDLKPEYNKIKKILGKLMTLAKGKYFAHKINYCKGNAKLLWKVINDITCRKKQKQETIPGIKLENGTTVWNQKKNC